jgi:hypothetical protein
MSVPSLQVQWPSTLEESGPAEDPSIVLSGTAQVGSTPFRITAIRVEPRLRFMPDYKADLGDAVYEREVLETLLEELGEVANTDNPQTLELATGVYVMWMAPASATC